MSGTSEDDDTRCKKKKKKKGKEIKIKKTQNKLIRRHHGNKLGFEIKCQWIIALEYTAQIKWRETLDHHGVKQNQVIFSDIDLSGWDAWLDRV